MSPRSAAATDLADAAPLFAALGDETRLALVDRLCAGGPLSITRLTTGAAVTRQAITKHLHILADAGLVHDSRGGGNASGSSTPTGSTRRAATRPDRPAVG